MRSVPKVDSAVLKLEWAFKRISELNELLREARPFRYILETNFQTGERATFAKRDEAVIAQCAHLSSEAVQHMRSALDHAYWEIVSPFATTPKEERAVQFPFTERAERLDEAVKNRLAHKVSPGFFAAVKALRPYKEPGGNKMLALLDSLNGPDKHRSLTPMADYKKIDARTMRRQVPDFPAFISECYFGGNGKDVVWDFTRPHGPEAPIVHQELEVPVSIVFSIPPYGPAMPAVPTLNALLGVAGDTIRVIREAA